jgi:beta-1,4-N-acetylglucosaminyltransferase
MTCFVTVGTTRFDRLVEQMVTTDVHLQLRQLGVQRVVLQIGHGEPPDQAVLREDLLPIESFRFSSEIETYMRDSLLVVSHAGAGSIMEALALRKPLLVVTNDELMDAHQSELADALHERGYLKRTSSRALADSLRDFSFEDVLPYPEKDLDAFPRLCESTMGF